jgi:hypothetical protein
MGADPSASKLFLHLLLDAEVVVGPLEDLPTGLAAIGMDEGSGISLPSDAVATLL